MGSEESAENACGGSSRRIDVLESGAIGEADTRPREPNADDDRATGGGALTAGHV